MQISQPTSLSSSQELAKLKPQSLAQQQQVNTRAQVEKDDQNENSNKTQAASRFDVDENALALANQQSVLNTKNKDQFARSNYDQPSEKNYTAISAYQSVDNLAQRESIQQAFGVDFFA
jgi:hypothetical protein